MAHISGHRDNSLSNAKPAKSASLDSSGALSPKLPLDAYRIPFAAKTLAEIRRLSPGEQYEAWNEVVKWSRMDGEGITGRVTVVALRESDTFAKTFDDVFVVIKGTASEPSITYFTGSTRPVSEIPRHKGQGNLNGRPAVGMVVPGAYRLTRREQLFDGLPAYNMRTLGGGERIPAVRNTHYDGRYSRDEWEASGKRGDTMGAVLLHAGLTSLDPNSIGCFSFPVDRYNEFRALVGDDVGDSFVIAVADAEAPSENASSRTAQAGG